MKQIDFVDFFCLVDSGVDLLLSAYSVALVLLLLSQYSSVVLCGVLVNSFSDFTFAPLHIE